MAVGVNRNPYDPSTGLTLPQVGAASGPPLHFWLAFLVPPLGWFPLFLLTWELANVIRFSSGLTLYHSAGFWLLVAICALWGCLWFAAANLLSLVAMSVKRLSVSTFCILCVSLCIVASIGQIWVAAKVMNAFSRSDILVVIVIAVVFSNAISCLASYGFSSYRHLSFGFIPSLVPWLILVLLFWF